MNTFYKTTCFSRWLNGIKNNLTKARVLTRINAAENGNFGKCRFVGESVWEMKLDFGPGYRLYYTQRGKKVYWLLAGGDKTTQQADIQRAITIAKEI